VDNLITLYVYGEVKTPGMLRPRLSANITLLKAIAQAGGTTDWALKSRVTVTRTDPKTGKETMIILDLNSIVKGRTKDLKLQDGDIIIVPEKKLFR
jgi:polysaccharide export outer membrane protein